MAAPSSMSNPMTNQFQQIYLQSTKGLVGVTSLMAQDSGQAVRADMAGERALVQMPPSIREIAVFQGLINCCLSFIYFPLRLPPTSSYSCWSPDGGRSRHDASRGCLRSQKPRRLLFHLSTGKVHVRFQLQGLSSIRCYMTLANKPPSPIRQEHLEVRDIENTLDSSVLH